MSDGKDRNRTTAHAPAGLGRLAMLPLRRRLLLNSVIHAVLFALALLTAFTVRFEIMGALSLDRLSESFLPWLPHFVLLKLVIFWRMKLLHGNWQHASVRDAINIVAACWLFLAITYVLVLVFRWLPERFMVAWPERVGNYFAAYSRGVLLLDFFATVFLVCTARLGVRIWREERRPISPEGVRRVLMIGAGSAADAILREINRMPVERYRVIGLVDDDPAKAGMLLHGVPVLGTTDQIREICEQYEIEEIIIAIPSATQKQLRRVVDLCQGTQLKFQQLPSVADLIDGRVSISQIRPVDIHDLLGRETVQLDDAAIGRFLHDRTVLITGAGGSIGSEMCRQVARYGPARLVLVEQAETPLFNIAGELRDSDESLKIVPCICDVYDRQRVRQLWQIHRPDVVIHAAAHKHVPLMEENCGEAIKNNILGTRNVADACCEYDVAEFVLISTDKAVSPSSVMGASKRIAEIYTQSLNGRDGCRTQFKAVRFGNVLGSAGSVVLTFKRQIARGGPVTVTHPDMQRYFMTIPEASQLVLQAAATGSGGQIYLLDMGEPVNIVDLARNMITLSGFRPDEDIEIVYTGIRPGEKLFEKLRTAGEDIEPTVHPKVRIWKHRTASAAFVDAHMRRLAALRETTDRAEVIREIRQMVPEYQPHQSAGGPASNETGTHAPAAESSTRSGAASPSAES